jgi:hypothetical protein
LTGFVTDRGDEEAAVHHRLIRLATALGQLIAVLAVASAPASGAAGDSWQAVVDTAAAAAPRVTFLVAEARDGECYPVAAVAADRHLAIASTFKLYVLGELARQVATGRARWTEQLTVSTILKSKPVGAMRYDAPGTRYSLRYFAERMIAESDNTATDHLIARLGRENVESAMVLLGHGAPELNTPLLMTRELFALKIMNDDRLIDAYLAADDTEQRRLLADRIDPLFLEPEGWGSWNGPRRIETLEWFASATDICLALARLKEMAERPGLAPVAEILALNRGGNVFDRKRWPTVAFKEGYEAGVYSLCWLLRRDDGRSYVVAAAFNDPAGDVDRAAAWRLAERAERLLRQID